MKKLFTILMLLGAGLTKAQTTLYSQNFNTGSASDWSLNTLDLGGDITGTDNKWVINNTYAGGSIIGTPVPATSDEPTGIAGAPESYYLHILSALGVSLGGPSNCNFDAGGTGLTYFAALNTPISTVGYSNVTFSFWWLCQGDAASAGKVYYRTASGGAWTQITTPIPTFYNSSTWNKDSVHLTAFDGQAFLEFGFQFTDGDATGSDPAFGIDDITVTGVAATTGVPTITVQPSDASGCAGATVTFNAVATGAISYQWQRSTTGTGGTFSNIISTTDGGIYSGYTTASLVVSGITSAESGYAYQLVATNGTGSTTTTPATLTLASAPVVGAITGSNTVCVGGTVTLTDTPSSGTWTSASGAVATVTAGGVVSGVAAGSTVISYTVSNACGVSTATLNVTVTTSESAGTISGVSTVCVGTSISLTDGVSGGTWASSTGNTSVTGGVVTGLTVGSDVIGYTVTGSCGTATATFNVTVLPALVVGALTGTDSVCMGSTTILSDTTAGGSWMMTNANATVAGGTVTGVAAGMDTVMYVINSPACGTDTVKTTVVVKALPNPVITVLGGHVLSVPTGYSSYQWSKGGTNIAGATNHTYTYTVSASYQVTVDSDGCAATTAAHNYNLSVGLVAGQDQGFGIIASGNNIVVSADYEPATDLQVRFFDASGRTFATGTWPAGNLSYSIDAASLPSGMYLVKLVGGSTSQVLRWVKH